MKSFQNHVERKVKGTVKETIVIGTMTRWQCFKSWSYGESQVKVKTAPSMKYNL